MVTIKKIRAVNMLGACAVGIFACIMLMVICPIVTDGANAEEVVIDDAAVGVDVNAASVVSIAINNKMGMDIVPKANGTFNAQTATLTVSTNNTDGYRLLMSTMDGKTVLSNVTTTTDKTITSVVGTNIVPSAFGANTWGYSLQSGEVEVGDTTGYSAVSASNAEIKNVGSGQTTGKDTYTLAFGAKVDTTIPAGRYSNQVVISAVANPLKLDNLQSLTYMQDMTPTICANTKGTDGNNVTKGNEPTKQLIDTRDGNVYYVSKLADGNCWMTQSLDYDITASRITNGQINPSNTDVSAVWNNSSTYRPTATETSIPGPLGTIPTTDTRSWDVGKYVLAVPTTGVTCNTDPAGGSTQNDGWNSVRPGQNLSQCQNVVNVSGTNWKPTYTAQNGTWFNSTHSSAFNKEIYQVGVAGAWGLNTTVAVKANNPNDLSQGGEYDPHYLMGNYYQWNTAVAGTGGDNKSSGTNGAADATPWNAPSSICPKGWQLPQSEMNTGSLDAKYGTKTFYKLFNTYSYSFPNKDGGGRLYGPNVQNNYNTATGPWYFNRSGNIDLNTGSIRTVSTSAHYWSSTAYPDVNNTYSLDFNSADTSPSYYFARWNGFSVRCVAR